MARKRSRAALISHHMRRAIGRVARATAAATAVVVTSVLVAPTASASAQSFCHGLEATFDGTYCTTVVTSVRNADRHIKTEVPVELIASPTTGPAIRGYLSNLFESWRTAASDMAQDSYAEAHIEIHHHGSVTSAVFHESYHADGPEFNNAYRTFTFDSGGRQLGLRDIVASEHDPLTVLPPLIQPYLIDALALAPPTHHRNTYPFTADRWAPDKIYSGGYRAWALTPEALLIYMPDYPVAHDVPINYSPGMPVWSMDGGTIRLRIPLVALDTVLRPEYRS